MGMPSARANTSAARILNQAEVKRGCIQAKVGRGVLTAPGPRERLRRPGTQTISRSGTSPAR
jgi:hypothetical protein